MYLRDDWWVNCEDCSERWPARYFESASEWADMHLADNPTHVVTFAGQRRNEED